MLLRHVLGLTGKPVLIGTWADATWAIDSCLGEKDSPLKQYWSIPARQVETSVVLADARFVEAAR